MHRCVCVWGGVAKIYTARATKTFLVQFPTFQDQLLDIVIQISQTLNWVKTLSGGTNSSADACKRIIALLR